MCVCVFQLCETQKVVILELAPKPQHVEIVNFHPFEDDESREQDLTSSPTHTTTENRSTCTYCTIFDPNSEHILWKSKDQDFA